MNIKDYFKLCEDHDWYYQMSEDQAIWKLAESGYKKLIRLSKESDDHVNVFNAWSDYIYKNDIKPKLSDIVYD